MAHGPWTHGTIYQLSILATQLGQRIVNVHHFEGTTASDSVPGGDANKLALCQNLIDAWQAACFTTWRAMHTSEYVVGTLRAQVLQVRNQVDHMLVPIEETLTTGNQGTNTSLAVDDTASAMNLKWRSTVAGKRHRGRTYVGPVGADWSSQGQVQSAGLTAMNAYIASMITTFGVLAGSNLDFRFTIYSKPFDQGEYGYAKGKNPNRQWYYPEDYDGDSTNVVNGVADPILRVQRRREIGVGV